MNKKNMNVICGMHFSTVNNQMVLSNKVYHWSIPSFLLGKIEKGNVVLVKIKSKKEIVRYVPVLVIDIIESFNNTDNSKLNSVIKILRKYNI